MKFRVVPANCCQLIFASSAFGNAALAWSSKLSADMVSVPVSVEVTVTSAGFREA